MHVQPSLVQIVGGSISAFANFAVCLTYFIFSDLRNLRYVELVFYVSINDFVASLGIALGGSRTGSFVCWFQAIVTNWQYLTAIFWTTVIAYQLWLAVEKNQTIQDMTRIHLFVWTFPILVTFLPLTTDTMGNADDQSTWCFISERKSSPQWTVPMWDILCYYLWVWLSTLTSFAFIIRARFALRNAPQETEVQLKNIELTKTKIKRLVLYPVIISLCWIISTVTDLYVSYHSEVSVHVYNAATFFAASQGAFLTIVFFYVNPMIRHKWWILFENLYYYLKSWLVQDDGDEKNNSQSTDRGVSIFQPNSHRSHQQQQQQQAADAIGRPSNMRGTLAWATASDLQYNIEDEPDYIKPRPKRSNSSLSDRLSGSNSSGAAPAASGGGRGTTIEMQNSSTRSSVFSSLFGASSSAPSSPTANQSPGSRHASSSGAIRNPVVQQMNANNVTVTDDEGLRDSEASVDSV